MSKITYITLAGKDYPMSFSLGATRRLIQRYGSVEKMQERIKKEGNEADKLEAIVEILTLLISQGCAYKNFFEKDLPAPENAPIINGKWEPLPAEVIEVAVDIFDAEDMVAKIVECISGGSKKDVEAKPDKKMSEPL